MELRERVAIVTGASRGLGRAMALALAERGVRVAVAARGRPELEQAAESIRRAGGKALAVVADVRDEAQVESLAATVIGHYGRVDVLVNNAGLMVGDAAFTEVTPTLWREVLDTNLWGAFLCCRAVVPELIRRGDGAIVNISSGAAVRTGFLNIPYGVSKAGLDRLTLGLAAELRDRGVACVSLSPSVSATDTVRRLYPDRDVDSFAQPPELAAQALVTLLEDDIMAYSGRVLSAREYLRRRGLL